MSLFGRKAEISKIMDVYALMKEKITDYGNGKLRSFPHVSANVQGRVISKNTYLRETDKGEKVEEMEVVISDDSGHMTVVSDFREDVWNIEIGRDIVLEGLSGDYAPENGKDESPEGSIESMKFSFRGARITGVPDEKKGRGLFVVGTVRGGVEYGEIPHSRSGNRSRDRLAREYRIRRVDGDYQISWDGYLRNKGENQNVVIAGGSGYGKTTLIYWLIRQMGDYRKAIFAYKNSDEFDRLGYPVLRIGSYSPNVFIDKEAFTQAWMVAFGVRDGSSGITASHVESTIRGIVSSCHNWEEFRSEVERRLKRARSYVEQGALADIEGKLHSVYSERMWNISLPEEICLDFSGLNEESFKFNAEYLLRSLYRELSEGKRGRTQIVIDEGHKFLGSGKTVVREIAAMIRSRGAFIISTQELHSLKSIRGNASMQFSFRLTEAEDLQDSGALSNEYRWIVQRLYPYEFVDLAQFASEENIYIFSIREPVERFYFPVEWKPEASKERGGETEEKQGRGRSVIGGLELDESVYSAIASVPRTRYEISRDISQKTGGDVNELKLRVKDSIERIARQGRISSFRLDGVRFGDGKTYPYAGGEATVYFRSESYDGHEYVVAMVARILEGKGLRPEVQSHGDSSADILVEEGRLAVEVEMGTKKGDKMEKTRQRIEREKREGCRVIVVTPSLDLKERYVSMAETVTPRELWELNLESTHQK